MKDLLREFIFTKVVTSKLKSKLKKYSAYDVVKGTPETQLDGHIVKSNFEAFSLFINEGMNSQIVERTN